MNFFSDFSISLAIILGLAFILIKAANLIVGQVEYFTRHARLRSFGVASIVAALSTSIPELIVAVTSAFSGKNALSLGNIMGSNIANISLVMGLAAVLGGVVKGSGQFVKQEVFYGFLIGTIPSLLLLDGSLSRLDGFILIGMYVMYTIKELAKTASPKKSASANTHKNIITRIGLVHRWANAKAERHIALFIGSMTVMIISAELLVRTASSLANLVHVPVFLVGLLVVSIGTTLPELAFEIEAIKKRESSLAFGNIIGSIVANSTLILGISATINPIVLTGDLRAYLFSVISFILVFIVFWRSVWTKHRLDRLEGAFLVLAYTAFVITQYLLR